MTKQKLFATIALGAALCLLSVAPSYSATVNVGDTIVLSGATGRLSWAGGAFHIMDTTTLFGWDSYCLEKNETINFGGTFRVDSIGPSAIAGGLGTSPTPGPINGPGSSDPISSQTAYLYYRYATGTISGVSGPGTGAQQQALQNVFWFLENEISALPSDPDGFGAQYKAIADAANGSSYGVAVVNPTYPDGSRAQSQLVYIPISVPEAGALLLFGTGLVGLVGYRRIRRMK